MPLSGGQFSQKSSWKAPHSSAIRVSYGVSFVISNSDLYSVLVSSVMYVISRYFEPCYNGTRLYYDNALRWMPWALTSDQSTMVLGPVSLKVFPSQFKFDGNSISPWHRFHYGDRYKILYMARQLSCRGMCKNLLRSDRQQRNYGKAKFPSNLYCGLKNVCETGPGNGLVPSGNKPIADPMLMKLEVMGLHLTTMSSIIDFQGMWKSIIFKLIMQRVDGVLTAKLLSDECHRTSLMGRQHWFR